ncbi:MAG: AAA family ATPase, partial [Proteobacteria bacterium]|nr:AAA family ATPase [Pseudomonadota bacterium]
MSTPEKLIPFRAQSESFTVFKDEGCYYVDKTGFIRHLIENGDKICVCTRPRRFGKTLMLKTLKAFFEFAYDREGNIVDNRRYFEGLKVMQSSDRVLAHMGQYPVIFLSLKDVKGDSYALICDQMRSAI